MYNVVRKFTFGGSIMAVWQLTAYAKEGTDEFKRIIEALGKAQTRLNANVNFDLVIELLLLTIKEN